MNRSNFFREKNENEAFRGVCWEHAKYRTRSRTRSILVLKSKAL